jgi:hypothetical protein
MDNGVPDTPWDQLAALAQMLGVRFNYYAPKVSIAEMQEKVLLLKAKARDHDSGRKERR